MTSISMCSPESSFSVLYPTKLPLGVISADHDDGMLKLISVSDEKDNPGRIILKRLASMAFERLLS